MFSCEFLFNAQVFLLEGLNIFSSFLLFNNNLLTFSHSVTLLISVCVVMFKVLQHLLLKEIFILSAKNRNAEWQFTA